MIKFKRDINEIMKNGAKLELYSCNSKMKV